MLLDTNAISVWAKGEAALWQALRPDGTWYLPSIALGEYR
jgi:predicted nucleic acid-binding protein